MNVQRQHPDGAWESADALGWQGNGVDVEIGRSGKDYRKRYRWALYDRSRLVRAGSARTLLGAKVAGLWSQWTYRKR